MKLPSVLLYSALLLCNGCGSHKPTTLAGQYAHTFKADVSVGSYYKTKSFTYFYDSQPDSLIGKTPTHIWTTSHVVQLMDANSGGDWARVLDDQGDSGFVRFDNLKIVPLEQQPSAPKKHRLRDDY